MMTRPLRLLRDPALLCLLALVAVNGIALSPELRAGRFDLNDSVMHYTIIDRLVQAIQRGENPLDCWVSEWTLGYPVPRTYQTLGHLVIALVYLALGKTVSLLTLFIWARYLLVALLPLSVYASARLLMLERWTAVASAALSPFLATNGLYGLEYGSYLWRGNGLFTQALAMHLVLLTLGFGYRVMHRRSSPAVAGLLLGLTFLAHFVYGFIAALSILMLTFVPGVLDLPKRVARTVMIGCAAFAVAAFQLVPMFLDESLINHSRWEPQWKWDSFGALNVFQMLIRGDLLDFGRLPVLSVLALSGAVVCIVKIRKDETYRFLLTGGALWLLLFCGRPAWGVLFTILGADQLPLHRLIGGVHTFAFFFAGIGLATFWKCCLDTRFAYRKTIAAGLTCLVLFPVLSERGFFLRRNNEWSEMNLAALDIERKDVDAAISAINASRGRAYSGKAAAWGNEFKVGSVPFFAILSSRHIPAVSFLYHAMALTSDLMIWFDDANAAHYRLFNVSSVAAPSSRPVAAFLTASSLVGRFQIYQTPANGYFDIVQVPYAARVYPENFYDFNYAWLTSNWAGRLNHVLLDRDGHADTNVPRLGYGQALPDVAPANLGTVLNEKRDGEVYETTAQLREPGYLLFKMTYHPNWTTLVDGTPQSPVMLTPGFMGVKLEAGRHAVQFRYQPGSLKAVLILLGGLVLLTIVLVERRRGIERIDLAIDRCILNVRAWAGSPRLASLLTLAGLVALSLPVSVPLFTNQLVSGHDAFSYVPRLIEFHENIRHGVFLPRWAPDLGSGHGQPLFVFNPPLLYYLAEVWYALGFDPTTSYNLVSVTIIFAAAAFMYLLGKLYFGRSGGWLAAAAYIYAPYFHVDLYVRQALAEYSAFPFYPLTLYGFGRFARDRDRRWLILGAAGFAGVILAHNAAALLFAPVVAVFAAVTAWLARSWKLLLQFAAGILLGFGLSAFIWLPVLLEMKNVHVERLLEGYLQYSNHLVYPKQFLSTNWGFGLSVTGPDDGLSFSLGWSHVLILMVALGLGRHDKKTRATVFLFTALALAYCFVMTPPALPIWDRLPILQQIEFPWRMLGPVAACVAVVIASLPIVFAKLKQGPGLAIALALIIGPNLNHIRAERYYHLSASDWTPEQIARRGVSVATREEYEPRSVPTRPQFESDKFRLLRGDATIAELATNPISWSARISARTDSLFEANLSYFPGWTASIDGTKAPQDMSPQTGNIQLNVPAGERRVKLEFQRTPARFWSELVSVVAFLTAGLAICL